MKKRRLDPKEAKADKQKGWKAFRRMGKNAVAGKLPNASTNHDRYLYGEKGMVHNWDNTLEAQWNHGGTETRRKPESQKARKLEDE